MYIHVHVYIHVCVHIHFTASPSLPISLPQVPDYLDVITQPMDFGTMRKRVESHHYSNLDEFESDFYLVWHNATVYNAKDTIYYRAAIRIKDAGIYMYIQCTHSHRDTCTWKYMCIAH